LSKILVVDDDKNLPEAIRYSLINDGYTVQPQRLVTVRGFGYKLEG